MFVWKPVESSEKFYTLLINSNMFSNILSPFILSATQKQMKMTVLCSEVARCLECQSDGHTKKNVNNCFFHSYCTHFVIFLPFSLNVLRIAKQNQLEENFLTLQYIEGRWRATVGAVSKALASGQCGPD